MGKLDDIRKQREAQFAQQEREAGGQARAVVASTTKKSSEVVEGKCSECGKLKAVQNGLVVSHQKGLGKMCAGSRKGPD